MNTTRCLFLFWALTVPVTLLQPGCAVAPDALLRPAATSVVTEEDESDRVSERDWSQEHSVSRPLTDDSANPESKPSGVRPVVWEENEWISDKVPDSDPADADGTGETAFPLETTFEQAEDLFELSSAVHLLPRQDVASEGELTLQTVEQIALTHNPAIRQAEAASARAGGIRTQVGLRPNPSMGYFGQEIGNENAGGQHGAFVSQTFVRGGKLDLNRRVISHDVNAMNWQIEAQRQRVLTDIRVAFYEALAAQRRLELAREFRGVAQRGVSISEQRIEAQVGSRPDLLQSEIQLNEVDLTIQQAEYQLSAALQELAALAGVNDLGDRKLAGELNRQVVERDTESEFLKIVQNSPELAAARAQADRARVNLQRQKVQPIPNITGQVGAAYDDSTGNSFANIQLSLPVPVHNRNQGNIRAAFAAYCAATQNVRRIEQRIRRDLARVMREYRVAEATVRRYEESILPRARETLELMQKAQEAGEFDFLRVLIVRRAYFDANFQYVTALGRLAQAEAQLDGLLLTGGLTTVPMYTKQASLRGQALSGQ